MNEILACGAFPPKNDYLWVTWSLLTACNYSCRYCNVKGSGYASSDTIHNTIDFIRNAPQKVKDVTLFGGEPTIHSSVNDILDSLKSICRNVFIFTNCSSQERCLSIFVSKGIKFCLSYHPDIISDNDFLKKMSFLIKENAYIEFVNVMMVDGKRKEIDSVCAFCRDNNIRHRILPVYSENGKSDWIKSVKYSRRNDVIPIRNTIVVKEGKKSILSEQECVSFGITRFKGYLCYSGIRSIFIDHLGNVFRCQNDMRKKNIFCNVKDTYPNIGYPYTCPHNECTCEYYIPKEISFGTANRLL